GPGVYHHHAAGPDSSHRGLSRAGLPLLLDRILAGAHPRITGRGYDRNRSLPANPNLSGSAHRRGLLGTASGLCAGLGVADPAACPPHNESPAAPTPRAPTTGTPRLAAPNHHPVRGRGYYPVAHVHTGRT